jgi:hypothetical protein
VFDVMIRLVGTGRPEAPERDIGIHEQHDTGHGVHDAWADVADGEAGFRRFLRVR